MKLAQVLIAVCAACALSGCSGGTDDSGPSKVDYSGEQPSAPLANPNLPLAQNTAQPKAMPHALKGLAIGTKSKGSK